jgi:hypothetical protein
MLVQWDKPEDNKTWRYRVTNSGRIDQKSFSVEGKALIDAGSLSVEMGINPEKELVACMTWAKTSFPANKYALILWNHGSGIEDPRKLNKHIAKFGLPFTPWLQIPGYPAKEFAKQRGILFDDSQNTYLTNQGLTRAMASIKTVLGKNLDLLGMDACLMAMIEVGYQVKDSVNVLVGSQNVEAGEGWAYSGLLSVFDKNPATVTTEMFATAIVAAYHNFYQSGANADPSHTQSAINLANLNTIGANINQLVAALINCKKINATRTQTAIRDAYRAAIKFDMPEYIDLYSFYAGLSTRIGKHVGGNPKPNDAYDQATAQVRQIAAIGMKLVLATVIANAVGSDFAQAKGLSIYLPANGAVHASYPLTLFAKNTTWDTFLKTFKVS